MKKFLSLALALTLCASLAACSNGGNTSTSGSESTSGSGSGSSSQAESDMQYVKDKGTLVVGITNFEPMDYQDENGNWIGFDADMAKAFAKSLGVDVEFQEINWDYKVMELDAKNIDCVWNGMTIDDQVKAAMSVSDPYCLNAQVLVVPADKADQFQSVEDLKGLTVAVESGSAGEDAAEALGLTTVPVQKQSDTLMEVSAGTSDAAVIDLLMAGAMIGEGTSYADLTYTLNLNEARDLESEEYGVGFRQGSDLTEAYNEFWASAVADGSALETANTYGVQDAVILE